MKPLYIFINFIFYFSILFGQNTDTYHFLDKINCKIDRIDSLDNFYLIYAQSDSNQYKILSRKIPITCRNIIPGNNYLLDIYERFPVPLNYLDVDMIVGAGTIIKIDWGDNLYISHQIWGLCYENDPTKILSYQQWVNKEEEFENKMYDIWYFYEEKVSENKIIKKSFKNFFKDKITNSKNAFFKNNSDKIILYSSPMKDNISDAIFVKNIPKKDLLVKVYYQYKNLCFIKAYYKEKDLNPLYGWVKKKYVQVNNRENL